MNNLKKVLVVGVGSIGERHVRCFGGTGRAKLSICELNPELGQSVAERYRVERLFANYEEALASEPDITVICTPAQWHIRMAQQAVDRGISVLVEKPLSTSLDGVDALIQSVKNRDVIAGVAYVYRSHPALRAMRQAIVDGRFGRALTIVAQSGQHFPLYRPAYREIYYNRRETGGGAVQDALTHVINAGEWLVGPVDKLVADIDHQSLEGVNVEDTAHVLTRHGTVMGCFNLNQHQAPNETTITVICTQGTARFEFHENRWRWMIEPGSSWHDEKMPPLERDSLFIAQANAFLDSVESRTKPLCTLDEAQQTLNVNLAILQSADKGGWRRLPGGGCKSGGCVSVESEST
jgi:predicted dehydrogenase